MNHLVIKPKTPGAILTSMNASVRLNGRDIGEGLQSINFILNTTNHTIGKVTLELVCDIKIEGIGEIEKGEREKGICAGCKNWKSPGSRLWGFCKDKSKEMKRYETCPAFDPRKKTIPQPIAIPYYPISNSLPSTPGIYNSYHYP